MMALWKQIAVTLAVGLTGDGLMSAGEERVAGRRLRTPGGGLLIFVETGEGSIAIDLDPDATLLDLYKAAQLPRGQKLVFQESVLRRDTTRVADTGISGEVKLGVVYVQKPVPLTYDGRELQPAYPNWGKLPLGDDPLSENSFQDIFHKFLQGSLPSECPRLHAFDIQLQVETRLSPDLRDRDRATFFRELKEESDDDDLRVHLKPVFRGDTRFLMWFTGKADGGLQRTIEFNVPSSHETVAAVGRQLNFCILPDSSEDEE